MIPLGAARGHAAPADTGAFRSRTKTLKELGYAQVYNLGAFKDWAESGGAVDRPIEPGMS